MHVTKAFAGLRTLALLSLVTVLVGNAQALSVVPGYPNTLCDPDYVSAHPDDLKIRVKPNNVDDTDNIQCALEEAVRMGVPKVQLDTADYFISSLSIENFQGTLQGVTKNATRVLVRDNSIDCSSFFDRNRVPAAMKFIGGEPRLRYLTMIAHEACDDGGRLTAMLHFTGAAASELQCDNDVIFGSVDRVILDGTSRTTGPIISVSAQPEGYVLHPIKPDACNRTLAGTFSLNRSEVANTRFGIATSMRASAQVGITFNQFEENEASVWVENAKQNTLVSRNTFLGLRNGGAKGDVHVGIGQTVYTEQGDTPPDTSRINVTENTLRLKPRGEEEILGFYAASRNKTLIDAVVSRNTFRLELQTRKGIWTTDIQNGHLSGNAFISDEGDSELIDAIEIDVGEGTEINGWTISGNDFDGFRANLMGATSGNFIGPNQGASILDLGFGNIVMEEGNFMLIVDQTVMSGEHRPSKNANGQETVRMSDEAVQLKLRELSRSMSIHDRW